jgi:hypothetical protein
LVGLENEALTIMMVSNSRLTHPDVHKRFGDAMKSIAASPVWAARIKATLEACATAERPAVPTCSRRARARARGGRTVLTWARLRALLRKHNLLTHHV